MGKGSGSAKQQVVEYRMSMHIGVGHALDAVTEVRIDEKVAWAGRINTNTAISINRPDLFGGQKKEGGLVGAIHVLLGGPDQVLPAPVAARYGRAPEDCPAFRGLTTLFFTGNGSYSTGWSGDWSGGGGTGGGGGFGGGWFDQDDFVRQIEVEPQTMGLMSTTPSGANVGDGFMWKMNSPVIAQKVEITGVRAPKGLNPATALSDADDANFIHIIYEVMTNTEWGMGGLPSLIDKAGFEAEAQRLVGEGMFGSLWWMRQSTCEDFIVEMLDHIQATLFLNPNTGLVSIKLLRDDYDLASLRHITPANATLSNFKRRSGGEIVNELTVSWTNPENEQTESVTAQDIASIESQGGEKVPGSRNYYAIRNKDLAVKVLTRDLTASTAPLISADAALDRSAWDLLPGEVVLLSWPKRQAFSVVMRVGKVSYGKPLDSKIRASMLQDVFSLKKPPIRLLPDTEWPDPSADPQPLTMQLFTAPAFFTRNAEIQNVPVDLEDGEALVGALADSETYDSFDYELISQSVAANGETVFTSKGAMSMTGRAVLSLAMAPASVSTLPVDLFEVLDEAPRVGGFVVLGYGDEEQEFCLVTARGAGGWTLDRGVLDTVPRAWSAGTPVWVVNPGARIVDSQTIHGEGTTASYRGLDRTSRGLLGIDQAPVVETVVSNRAHLPLRPANVRLNGVGFGSTDVSGELWLYFTWATRNRLMEDSRALRWTDGAIQPEYRQETVVRAINASTGQLIIEYDALWTENGLGLPKRFFDRYSTVRFEVYSRRDGRVSLHRHSVTATGFNADPTAPPPEPGGERRDPPSFYPAPADSAFEIASVVILAADGSSSPSIEISGIQDREEPRYLVARYRAILQPEEEGGEARVQPWQLSALAPLNQERMRFTISGLLGETPYEVEVAYFVNDVIGIWRPLGDVVTSKLIAGDLSPGSKAIRDIADDVFKRVEDLFNQVEGSEKLAEVLLETILNEHEALQKEAKERNEGIAKALFTSFEYADEKYAQAEFSFVAVAAFEDALAVSQQTSRAYTDAFKAEASQTFATIASLNGGLAATLQQANAYSDGVKAYADLSFYTKAQTDSGLATTLQLARSYSDGQYQQAQLIFSTKTEMDAARAQAVQEAKSYTDSYKTEASLLFATQTMLNGVSASAALALSTSQSVDGRVKSQITLAQNVDGLISGVVSENDGVTAAISILSSVFNLYSTGSGAQTSYIDGRWYILDPAESTLTIFGLPFGGAEKLVWWTGSSSVGIGGAAKGNAAVYISMNAVGGPRFGGSDVPTGGGGGGAGSGIINFGGQGNPVTAPAKNLPAGTQLKDMVFSIGGGSITNPDGINVLIGIYANNIQMHQEAVTVPSQGLQNPDGSWVAGSASLQVTNRPCPTSGSVQFSMQILAISGGSFSQAASMSGQIFAVLPI